MYLLKYSSPHTFSSKTHNYFFLALFHLYKYSWPLSKIQMDAFLCYVSYRVMWVSKRKKWYEIMFCLHYLNVGIWTYIIKICHFRSSSLTTNLKNKIPDILWQNWNLKWIRHGSELMVWRNGGRRALEFLELCSRIKSSGQLLTFSWL